MHTQPRLSDELARVAKFCERPRVTYGELMQTVEHRSHALMALLFALPFMLPMPLPGLSIPFGIILIVVGLKKSLGHKPWIPSRILHREVPSRLFVDIFTKGSKVFRRFEKVVRPRGQWIQRTPFVRQANGILISLCGVLLSLPLPPGTNFPPAACVVLIAIGVLEHDAVFLVVAYVVFLLNVALFTAIFLFGVHGVQWLSKYSEFMHKF